MMARLRCENLSVSFGKKAVLTGLSLDIPDQKIAAIVGPNACGKSTLLRCLARLQKPSSGAVLLDDKPIRKQKTRAVAQRLALLPQSASAPLGMRVIDLVAKGRTPHQTPMQQWSRTDEEVVLNALEQVNLADHAQTPLSSLSGGQRQRAWLAMVLAQDTDILLLDEPTTFLDLKYQIEILRLVREVQSARGMTVAMILQDINLAARYTDWIIALKAGQVLCEGPPEQVVTAENVEAIYDMPSQVIPDPVSGSPMVVPR